MYVIVVVMSKDIKDKYTINQRCAICGKKIKMGEKIVASRWNRVVPKRQQRLYTFKYCCHAHHLKDDLVEELYAKYIASII